MYIHPNTTIRLLKDVPLDTSYSDTLYFESLEAQQDYFGNRTAKSFNQQMYQRVDKGTLRVRVNADDIYDYNYLSFRNTAYGDKQFYAFITGIEYINDAVSEVRYQIDLLQTWYFDYDLGHCFVEREHSATDEIGDNIIPENLELGEYVFNDYRAVSEIDLTEYYVIIAVADTRGTTVEGNVYDGIYGGATLYAYNLTDTTVIDTFLANYIKAPDNIIGMYLVPAIFVYGGHIPVGHKLPKTASGSTKDVTFPSVEKGDNIDGHPVRNNKLYTYPYNFLHIDNSDGSELALRYEFFNDPSSIKARITSVITQPVTAVLRPLNYKCKGTEGITNNPTMNTESISLSSYPMCSWNTDTFKAWIAQNAVPMAIRLGAEGISYSIAREHAEDRGKGEETDVDTNQAISSVHTVANMLTDVYRASIRADVVKGDIHNANNNVSNGNQTFFYGRCSISKQYAEMIDNYFSVYGYATKKTKIPNGKQTRVRDTWCYTKTVGCIVTGSVPASDLAKIRKIYDRGVTFWYDPDKVGRYDMQNKCYTGE